ncbi:MAG: hypothetical protein WBF06_01200 [Candidatus Acidiferrales bacterium]
MPKQTKSRTRARPPRTQRELARAVFKRHNPVDMACELLSSDGKKGSSVKARVWEKLIEFGFGKARVEPATPAAEEDEPVIWDMPGPDREQQV